MARTTNSQKHIHKYYYVGPLGNKLWVCALPGCTHYMPKNVNYGNVEGKYSICWECEEEFVLNAISMQNDKPRCPTCITGVKPEALKELIEQKMGVKSSLFGD